MVPEHTDHIAAIVALAGQSFQLSHIIRIVEEGILSVPLVDDPAPGGPAPDGEGGGEEIVVGAVFSHLVNVETRDHRDALIVLVLIKHLLAEGEERLCRHVVVFQHHTLINDRKGPFL